MQWTVKAFYNYMQRNAMTTVLETTAIGRQKGIGCKYPAKPRPSGGSEDMTQPDKLNHHGDVSQ